MNIKTKHFEPETGSAQKREHRGLTRRDQELTCRSSSPLTGSYFGRGFFFFFQDEYSLRLWTGGLAMEKVKLKASTAPKRGSDPIKPDLKPTYRLAF